WRGLRRCPSRGRRRALSGLAPAGTEGAIGIRVGPVREQPASQVLSSDSSRAKGAGSRVGTMDPRQRGDRQSDGNGLMQFSELKLRWKALIHHRQFERDVDDELAFHLAMQQAQLREDGMEPSAARFAANVRFGNAARAGETLREMRG